MAKDSAASAPSSGPIRALLDAGRFREAIRQACKMRDLGSQKARIERAREAYERPEFQLALGKNPDALIADGVAAMRERFCAES